MADDAELQARLESHSKAFEGLMSLIPAKSHYGEDDDNNEWPKKKKSKEQKKAAKRAKLQPDAYKSALDVHQDNERKRKRDLADEHVNLHDSGSVISGKGLPKDNIQSKNEPNKKHKPDSRPSDGPEIDRDASGTEDSPGDQRHSDEADEEDDDDDEAKRGAKIAKRRQKREQKKMKKQKAREKEERRKERRRQGTSGAPSMIATDSAPVQKAPMPMVKASKQDAQTPQVSANLQATNFELNPEISLDSSVASSPEPEPFIFGNSENQSSASSSSSILPPASSIATRPEIKQSRISEEPSSDSNVPPSTRHTPFLDTSAVSGSIPSSAANLPRDSSPKAFEEKAPVPDQEHSATVPPHTAPKPARIDHAELHERLMSRLAALRAARKADGPDGQPARNRQELIEGRRRKAEARKARKRDVRAQERLQRDAEQEAARLRGGSGSPLWSPSAYGPGGALANPLADPANQNFSFGRVAFNDGTELGINGVRLAKKKKGPTDTKTALAAAQKEDQRKAAMDPEKRADIDSKDRWLNAKKRAQGEKIKDDTALLKKALKRKEKAKDKSEREWNERLEGVKKGQEMRQKKREENLQRRRDGKGAKGRKNQAKPKRRPGFEGTFKTGKPGL